MLRQYKYSISFLLSIVCAVVLQSTGVMENFVGLLDTYGYIGAFVNGLFISTTLTAAPATVLFFDFGKNLNPLLVGLLGGTGAMVGDLLMYRFIKESLMEEFRAIGVYLIPIHRRELMERITKHTMFLWAAPFLASLLIASPLPDELGVSLFNFINFKPKYLSVVTFLLNTIGILCLVYLGSAVQ